MNILTLGSRVVGPEPAWECVVAFLGATFSGEPRHERRLAKVLAIEAAEQDHLAARSSGQSPASVPRPNRS